MRIMHYALCIACSAMLSGCWHKDFCYHHPHGEIYVEVEYDDDKDPDDFVYLRDNVRATRLIAYHQTSGQMLMASDIDRSTNQLLLDADTYHFIACNAGAQSISFNNREQFYAHHVTTRECDILEPLYDSRAVKSDIDLGNNQPVVIGAEPIWGVGAEAMPVNLGDTICLTAIPLHCRYSFEIRDLEGLAGVSRLSAFITGMASGADLGSAELHDTPVTVAVPASVSADKKSIVGSFMCFGQNPNIDVRHRMGLFLEMQSGAKFKLLEGENFDVTDQVVNAPNRRRVHIIIDGVQIPTSVAGSGFEITVKPWGPGENLDVDYEF